MNEAIFLSDIHFGITQHSDKLFELLEEIEAKKIFIVGDLISFSVDSPNSELDRFFEIVNSKDWELYYLIGNHEKENLNFEKLQKYFENIDILESYYFEYKDKKIFIEHGDSFHYKDPINSFIKKTMLKIKVKNYKKSKKGFKKKRNIYYKIKPLIKLILYKPFMNYMQKQAIRNGANTVICGHLHEPKIVDFKKNVKYINCGDWTKSFSYIVLNKDGEFELKFKN